ncbi:MAG: ATP-binding cassette domain-containing protein [Runella sp.]
MFLETDSVQLAYFGRKVLQNIYLKVELGKITALLGRNGCGKSSLLKIIFGTLKAENQSVRFNGRYFSEAYTNKNLIRYLPQSSFVPNTLKVREAFEEYGVKGELLEDTNWEKVKNLKFDRLSGGERRFWEALLVVCSPVSFVLLDEPFSHLSPIFVEHLQKVMMTEKDKKGILMTDHLYNEVLSISNQVYFLQNGTTYLLSNPRQDLIDRGYIPAL